MLLDEVKDFKPDFLSKLQIEFTENNFKNYNLDVSFGEVGW